MYVLFTDTDCDVTPKMAEELGYNLISMPYYVAGKDGDKEVFPYVDFEEFDGHSFYDGLRHGTVVKTNALNPTIYKEKFEPFFKEGKDILYVHFSAAMSGTFSAMKIALDELKEMYPERNFYQIDTKGITVLSLNIALEVSKLYKEGKSVEEILAWAKDEVDKFTVYFFAEDLKFFRRSGRVSGLAAFFGTLASIRPLMYMGPDGKMSTVGKVRGRQAAMDRLIQYVDELGDDLANHTTIIAHSDALDIAQELEKRLKEKYQDKINTRIVEINPTIGSHCGPSAAGICFHAIHR